MGPVLCKGAVVRLLRHPRAPTGLQEWARGRERVAEVELVGCLIAWDGVACLFDGRDDRYVPVVRWRFGPRCQWQKREVMHDADLAFIRRD
jgi:hypothetical protein